MKGDKVMHQIDTLDAEWSLERTFQARAAGIALAGLGLGVFVNRRFLAIPAMAASFLLMHAITGWAPPVAVLRRLGYRTRREIESERCALAAAG